MPRGERAWACRGVAHALWTRRGAAPTHHQHRPLPTHNPRLGGRPEASPRNSSGRKLGGPLAAAQDSGVDPGRKEEGDRQGKGQQELDRLGPEGCTGAPRVTASLQHPRRLQQKHLTNGVQLSKGPRGARGLGWAGAGCGTYSGGRRIASPSG